MKSRWLALVMILVGGAGQAQGPAYDVALVKPNKGGGFSTSISIDDDRLKATNVTLKLMMIRGWDLKTEEQITGLPGWAGSDRFDIEAKLDAEQVAALKNLKPEASEEQQRMMLQALLVDRFGVKVHHETKVLATYALVVAKGGARLKPSASDAGNDSMNVNNRKLTATHLEVEALARFLSSNLHRLVEDKTGLKGRYDFSLEWSGDEAAGGDKAPEFPPLMTAIEEQLGVKLVATKGPVDTIVVDKVELPKEN